MRPCRCSGCAVALLLSLSLAGCGADDPAAATSLTAADVEQREAGPRLPLQLVERFEGLGEGFQGPQGVFRGRNPSDNSLAVGPDHIVQTVNSRLAVFTREGRLFDTTGEVLYGPVPTHTVFRGFGGTCEARNNGDAVVRYDQLADRWLIVMPIFRRGPPRSDQPPVWTAGDSVYLSPPGVEGQPGPAAVPFHPEDPPPEDSRGQAGRGRTAGRGGAPTAEEDGVYSVCYAVSTGPDPMGPYYRYEFLRPLFPDYPRPGVWPDGYYVATSSGDDVVQKHTCVVDRARMLRGEAATEQCFVLDGVNFLNNSDLDGRNLPPPGTPNFVLAAGGTQLDSILGDDAVYLWRFSVNWDDPSKTSLVGPEKIRVAPYAYLCGGQLTECVPQPGTDRRLDAQGDKIMARLVYRNLGNRQVMVAVHSVATEAGGGGVRWYEFEVDGQGAVSLRQQGTFAPDGNYRWMGSPALDRFGNLGIGYSFGGVATYTGQRFAGRLADDPLGRLTFEEAILVEGEGSQSNTFRWEDYTQTAVDPRDDCTIWYVGDYYRAGAESYSTRIGAFRFPECDASTGRALGRGGSSGGGRP